MLRSPCGANRPCVLELYIQNPPAKPGIEKRAIYTRDSPANSEK